jgi:Lrp/AsnC family leucine-responsive transcriptional regulator
MDQTDLKILGLLQENGRVANRDLAQQVGLSEAPCLRRVQRLQDEGVIQGYTAVLDPVAVHRSLVVFVDVLIQQPVGDHIEDFERGVQDIPEVTECHRLLGEVDYRLKVVAADIKTYDKLYIERITKLPGMSRTVSRASQHQIKYTTALPLPELPELRHGRGRSER